MARQSRTPIVLLGLLSAEPMSGYDLKASIDRSIGQFWNESYGQIYPALKTLEEEGLVTRSEEASGGRTRIVYTITELGRARLIEWLGERPATRQVRNELLVKVFFGRHAPPGAVLGFLMAEREEAYGTARGMTRVMEQLRLDLADSPDLPYWLLTLDLGRRNAQARAEWAEHSIALLQHGGAPRR